MDLVNKLDKLSITYFKIFCHIFNKKRQVGVPLGRQRGMTQNRNFFFFSVSRLKALNYRHLATKNTILSLFLILLTVNLTNFHNFLLKNLQKVNFL